MATPDNTNVHPCLGRGAASIPPASLPSPAGHCSHICPEPGAGMQSIHSLKSTVTDIRCHLVKLSCAETSKEVFVEGELVSGVQL